MPFASNILPRAPSMPVPVGSSATSSFTTSAIPRRWAHPRSPQQFRGLDRPNHHGYGESTRETTANITVTTSDVSSIEAVIVAYTDGSGAWASTTLTENADAWTGSFFAKVGTEFLVQVVDKAGNVAAKSAQFLVIYLPFIMKNH